MRTTSTCAQCGRPLVPGALGNRCPHCLLGFGLSDVDEEDEPESVSAGGPRTFGDYELLEELGRGGMGVVYRARQVSLNRIVAVKMLLARPFETPELEQRLHFEAEVAGALSHPNIVTIYEFGEHEDQFYFSMEYVEGRSLAQLTRHHSLSFTESARYLKIVAEAVHQAHEHGILHRDLKPSNILIDLHDQVKITDFGLAKRLGTDSELTLTGQVLGSPNYLSPEQAAGQHRALTVRSDVYSLGAVLYQLLTTRPPLVGESLQETLVQIREKAVPPPRILRVGIPRDLETICLKCLQKEPSRRYASAQSFADDLGRFLEGKPILARPVSTVSRVWLWCRRNPTLTGALAACGLALQVGIGGITWQWKRAEARERDAEAARQTSERERYATEMDLAFRAIEEHDLGTAERLLTNNIPRSGELDLRGLEWRLLWQQCQSGELTTLRPGSEVFGLAFSPDGSVLVSGTYDRITTWTLEALPRAKQRLRNRGDGKLAYSPDGRWVATKREKGRGVILWSTGSWELERVVTDAPISGSPCFSPGGDLLAAVNETDLGLWRLEPRFEELDQLEASYGEEPGQHKCAFSPDGTMIAYRTVSAQDETEFVLLRRVEPGTSEVVVAQFQALSVHTLAFSPDGQWLVIGNRRQIDVYDLTRRPYRKQHELRGHRANIPSIGFSEDGRTMASASIDHTIRLWDTANWKYLRTLVGHRHQVFALAFGRGANRNLLATGSRDSTIRLWRIEREEGQRGLLPGRLKSWAGAALGTQVEKRSL